MRLGKFVNIEDPLYLLDKNKGTVSIPTYSGNVPRLKIINLRHKNKVAYDNNIVELEVGQYRFRVHKDELTEAMKFA